MVSSIVVRVPRADTEAGQPILLRIEQAKPDRLDLHLFATDGENVFVAKTKHSTVERLQNTSFSGDLKQWQTILFATLVQQAKAVADPASQNVELAASFADNLEIIVRQNIGGITQRLGAIILKQNDDEEISLFDWTLDCAIQAATLQTQHNEMQAQNAEKDETIRSLRQQVEEAETAREKEVKQYMLKFSKLLNTKKLKIRNQQRSLSKAGIAATAEDSEDAPSRLVTGNRSKKRKAGEVEDGAQIKDEVPEDQTDDDDVTSDGSGAAQEDTPDPGSDTEPEADEPAEAVRASVPAEDSSSIAKHKGKRGQNQKEPSQNKSQRVIPPRRALPFAKAAQSKGKEQMDGQLDEETDDEVDDEL